MANFMFNLLRPAAPVVQKTALQVFRDFVSQPLVKGLSLWVGGLTAVAHSREIGSLVKGTFADEVPAGHLAFLSKVDGYGPKIAFLVGAGFAGVAVYKVMRRKPLIVTKPFAFESIVDGSDEVDMILAPSQVHVAIGVDNQIEVVGSGVRVDVGNRSFLVTAGHNVSRSTQALYLVKEGNFHRIPVAAVLGRKDLAADAVAIEIPPSVFSGLRVAKAVIGLQPNEAYVSVTGVSGRGTNGRLQLVRGQFGRLQYLGSTTGGYSGAPYWSGRSVYGIHTNGGHANEGFLLAYLYQVLKLELDVSDESGYYTFSWFKKFARSKGEKLIREVGDFVVMINDDGYCYSLPKAKHAEYEKMLRQQDALEAGREEYDGYEENEYDSDSYVQESKNWNRPGSSRAGRRSRSAPPSDADRQIQVKMLESLSRFSGYLDTLQKPSTSGTQRPVVIYRPKQKPKPSSNPSPSTQ